MKFSVLFLVFLFSVSSQKQIRIVKPIHSRLLDVHCPTPPESCPETGIFMDYKQREKLCLFDIVADIEISVEQNHCGTARVKDVFQGGHFLNETDYQLALEPFCQRTFHPEAYFRKGMFCIVVNQEKLKNATITLDENAMLFPGFCETHFCDFQKKHQALPNEFEGNDYSKQRGSQKRFELSLFDSLRDYFENIANDFVKDMWNGYFKAVDVPPECRLNYFCHAGFEVAKRVPNTITRLDSVSPIKYANNTLVMDSLKFGAQITPVEICDSRYPCTTDEAVKARINLSLEEFVNWLSGILNYFY